MENNSAARSAGLPGDIGKRAGEGAFGELIRNRTVCGVLSADLLMRWFAEQRTRHPGRTLLFLGRAVQGCADMLALGAIPGELDCGHTILQALVDEGRGSVLQCRLVSFSDMTPEVAQRLRGREYIFMP